MKSSVFGALTLDAIVVTPATFYAQGALAQGVNTAVPPADGARAAEVVAQLVTVAGAGREEALDGAGGHSQPIGSDRVE